jgi:serine/threonine-protein kinase
MTTTSDWIGKQLGRYRIVEDLGSGGMTSVFKAAVEDTGEVVALKVLPPNLTKNNEYVRRFKREYKVMAELVHPNLVRIHDYTSADGIHFYTMSFVTAPTLDRILKELAQASRSMPWRRVTRIGIGLLTALAYIHEAGIIHRDLKPVNLFVGDDDHVTLADFGLVKAMRQTAITVTPTFLGTIEYASPEQIDVSATVDHRSDLYQTGLLLFQSAAGKLPYNRRDIETMITEKCFKDGLASCRLINPEVPEELDAVLVKATRTDPAERFGSAAEMRAALERVAGAPPTAAAAAGGAPPAADA